MSKAAFESRLGDRDLAKQLSRVEPYFAAMELDSPVVATESGECERLAKHKLYEENELAERERWARSLPRESRETVSQQLKIARQQGPWRRIAKAPEAKDFSGLERDFPHFSEATGHFRRCSALARRSREQFLVATPCLLTGPAGIGKTAYAAALAALINAPVRVIDSAALTGGFSLGGLDIGYSTGKPGLVWDALQGECMSPILVLDEIDKADGGNYPAESALYTLLEPFTARRFTDQAIGLAVDASRIIWIATSNNAHLIEPALRTRFSQIHVPTPTPEQMKPIIASIDSALREGASWGKTFVEWLAPEVVERLSALTPREVTQALRSAYAAAAEAGRDHVLSVDIPEIRPARRDIGFV